jgi:TRAP-type mannitol/chloroaromatic compound transport system permease small subunit
VLLSCLISAGNAFSRYAFNYQLERLAGDPVVHVRRGDHARELPYTLKRNEHVRVDIVYANVSTRRQIGIDIFGFILFMLPATIIMAYLCWPIFYNSWHMGEISSNAGGLIRWPVKILLPLGFFLLSLQGISELIKRIAMITGYMKADLHYERPLQ